MDIEDIVQEVMKREYPIHAPMYGYDEQSMRTLIRHAIRLTAKRCAEIAKRKAALKREGATFSVEPFASADAEQARGCDYVAWDIRAEFGIDEDE